MIQTVGEVRTKPGRGDPTLSVSCSDKLAKWNILGIQGALIFSLLDEPIYYSSVTLCDHQYCDVNATARAIWERFDRKQHLFTINRPKVQMSRYNKFTYRKCSVHQVPSPSSLVWWSSHVTCTHEIAIEGIRQGVTKKSRKRKMGRLKISKIELFRCYLDILKIYNEKLRLFDSTTDFTALRYCDAKNSAQEYQKKWNDLKNNYFCSWTTKPKDLNIFVID